MGKANLSPVHHATKTYQRMEAHFHTTSALARGEWSVSRPYRFTLGKWLTVQTVRMLGGIHNDKCNVLDPKLPNFLWQGTTPVAMCWYVGRT